ncbi:MAG: HAD-IC family P-type ATPase [Patescibacteria group bacterium]|jgi:Mg2+-importing ATPase
MATYTSFATPPAPDVLTTLRSTPQGLTAAEATTRLAQYGPNTIATHRTSIFGIFFRQFRSPFLYLLAAAAVLSFALGGLFDGILILLFILINAALGFFQEYRSEQTANLLSRVIAQQCHVRRNDAIVRIPVAELVPGDIVLLEPGDRIPADLRFIDVQGLAVDESVFTGESAPVSKHADPLAAAPKDIFAASNIGFSGTTLSSGSATGVVCATGNQTAVGSIAKLTTETEKKSAFSIGIGRISTFILQLIGITLVFIFIANLAIHRGETNIIELIIFSIALAVSVTPEALPVVMTFSFSRGARRLAANKVVVKRLSAVEDLGSIEVLCTDKTGTLTENTLTVAETYGETEKAELLTFAAQAASSFSVKHEANNAFDLALFAALPEASRASFENEKPLRIYPFDPVARSNGVCIKQGKSQQVILRGAPETLLAAANLSAHESKDAYAWIDAQGFLGRRVLAVGKATVPHIPETLSDVKNITFSGLIAFVDPVKKTTPEAVSRAKALGVRIVILTGDSAAVAGAVGKEIGLLTDPTHVLTGEQFNALTETEKHRAVHEKAVFARTTPQDKFSIISLLKEDKLVGFLGEGINDAPALKVAHVALAVDHASDIARDTADIVLLKKNLKVIVDGICEGREIFANTTKYIRATLTSNFGNFYAVAVASLLIPFLPMLPVQILLLNLLSDFPMIAIAADTVDKEELKSPRAYNVKDIALSASVLGLVSSFFDFLVFATFVGMGAAVLQTNWFIASVLTELLLLFSIRTRLPMFRAKRPAGIVIWLSLLAILVTLVIPFTGFGQTLFKFEPPELADLGIILAIALVYLGVTEGVKLLYYRMSARRAASAH